MNISIKRKLLITAVSFTLVLILQLATTNSNSLELGEYLTVCYAMGEQGISSASAGGLFAGVISYFLCKLLTGVGSYVILGLALALLFFALVKDLMKQDKKDKKSDGKKFRSSFVEENGQIDNNTSNESDSQDKGVQGAGQTPQPIQSNPNQARQKLFINNPDSFALKNKREIQKDTGTSPIKLEFSQGGLNVARTDYSSLDTIKKDDEYKKKIDYIKTPSVIDMGKYSSSEHQSNSFSVPPTSGTTVSSYIPSNKTNKDEAKNCPEIPFIEHDNITKPSEASVEDSAEARAMAFGERYLDISESDKVSSVEQTSVIEDANKFDFSNVNANNESIDIQPKENLGEEKVELSSRTSRFDFSGLNETNSDTNPPMIEVDAEIDSYSLEQDNSIDSAMFD